MNNALIEMVAELLPEAGETLLVAHGSEAQEYLNLSPHIWMRTAGTSMKPQAWYDATEKFSAIFLPLPKGKASLELCLTCAATLLAADGKLYVFGGNDEGIKSAEATLQKYFADVAVEAIGGKGRIYAAHQPKQGLPANLHALATSTELTIADTRVEITSYPGLFAKGQLDKASALLIDHLPELSTKARVLDYACGLGVLAKATQLQQPDAQILLADYDPLAMHAAQLNVPGAQAVCTAGPESIRGTFDLIISNPPIHVGHALDYGIVERLVFCLPELLAHDGAAYIVAQVTVPVARYAANAKLAAVEAAASSGFRVTKISRV